jgi:hypothetical protein
MATRSAELFKPGPGMCRRRHAKPSGDPQAQILNLISPRTGLQTSEGAQREPLHCRQSVTPTFGSVSTGGLSDGNRAGSPTDRKRKIRTTIVNNNTLTTLCLSHLSRTGRYSRRPSHTSPSANAEPNGAGVEALRPLRGRATPEP